MRVKNGGGRCFSKLNRGKGSKGGQNEGYERRRGKVGARSILSSRDRHKETPLMVKGCARQDGNSSEFLRIKR